MTTRIYTHKVFARHDTGRHHPETVARLGAVLRGLAEPPFDGLETIEAPLADIETVALAHPAEHVEEVLAMVPRDGHRHLDPDTVVSADSGEAALRAVGAVCAAVDAVAAGEASNAFCAVRPPGHHAEPERAMGFCLFSNIAIAALHARARHGCERVAVVDFDVHHGNGTQAVFWADRDLFLGSTHQSPLYPGTGGAGETGVGNIFNVPLSPGAGSAPFRAAMSERILPALRAFRPDFVLISAGFDAHRDDPLGGLELDEADFAWITREVLEVAAEYCGGRVVSALEGGYNLQALTACTAAHVGVLMEA